MNLCVASGITKMGIRELTAAVWPWRLTRLMLPGVAIRWPRLALWPPHLQDT